MLVEALQTKLTTDPGMIALLGTKAQRPDSKNGVFPVLAPDQPSMPYVVVDQVSGSPDDELFSGTGPLVGERWRLSCSGTTYKNAKTLAKYVKKLLLGWYGPQTADQVFIQSVAWVMEADDAETMMKGTLFTTHLDFNFVYIDEYTA